MTLQRLKLETTRENLLARFIDLVAPLAKGQRGLIVGPRYAGQRLILETIASSVAMNHPEIMVMMLLLDQHEDEAAAVRRSVKSKVFFSACQESEVKHIHLAETALAEANCLVENRRDALVLMDSLTRLARSYGEVLPFLEGTSLSAFNPFALRQTRRFVEATRPRAASGSLTIVAIADVELPTPVEGMLLEDLRGVADMQIVLENKVLSGGIFPAVNIHRSCNNSQEFISPEDVARIHVLRKVLEPLSAVEAAKLLGSKFLRTSSNRQF